MANTFVPLREYLQPLQRPEDQPAHSENQNCHLEERSQSASRRAEETTEITDVIAAARRFHVAVTESVERATERVLHELAYEVLGRELLLAPVDIDAIVKRLLVEAEETSVIRIDANPERGDIMLELRDGTLDASLCVRLEYALRTAGVA